MNGTIYLRLVSLTPCPALGNAANLLPSAQVLKVHHYFGMRPRKTSLYAAFQQRDWTAYLGMGGEQNGYAIAGGLPPPLCTRRYNAKSIAGLLAGKMLKQERVVCWVCGLITSQV